MQGVSNYLRLKLLSKTGFSGSLVVWALLGLFGAIGTLCFLIVAAFVWVADRYGSLNAALVLGAFFLLTTVIAIVSCIVIHRGTVRRAELELAARGSAAWLGPGLLRVGLQPGLLRMGLQAGRAVDWRKVAPVVAVGVLATAVGMHWLGRGRANGDHGEVEERVRARAA